MTTLIDQIERIKQPTIKYTDLSTPLKVFVWLAWLTIILNLGLFLLGILIGVVEVMMGA